VRVFGALRVVETFPVDLEPVPNVKDLDEEVEVRVFALGFAVEAARALLAFCLYFLVPCFPIICRTSWVIKFEKPEPPIEPAWAERPAMTFAAAIPIF
jgi:hypothetical protein